MEKERGGDLTTSVKIRYGLLVVAAYFVGYFLGKKTK